MFFVTYTFETGVCTNATAPSVSSINRILRNRAAERAAAEFARNYQLAAAASAVHYPIPPPPPAAVHPFASGKTEWWICTQYNGHNWTHKHPLPTAFATVESLARVTFFQLPKTQVKSKQCIHFLDTQIKFCSSPLFLSLFFPLLTSLDTGLYTLNHTFTLMTCFGDFRSV